MQLDDLIKQERIENIAKRTHVSIPVIEKLQNREFDLLKKPQVVGTLGIIEREYAEYDLDFSALKEECNNYFVLNKSNDSRFLVLEPEDENHIVSKLFVVILLFLLIYSAWYFFGSYYKPAIHDIEPKNEKTFMDIIIEGKDTIMDTVGGKSSENTTFETKINDEENQSQKSAVVVQSQASQENIVTDKPAVKESVPAPVVVPKQVSVESKQVVAVVEEPTAVEEIVKSDKPKNPLSIKRQKITLLPQKMMLFQLTNIESKKVLKFKRKEQYDIDIKESAWLFHSKDTVFAFIDNDIFEEYGGEGDIFFRLDENGIHPLTEDEYKKY